MRKFVIHTLLAAVLAATVTTTACQKGDPNALETHVKKLDDAEARAEAFNQLERIVSGIATDPDDTARRDKFAETVLPKFEEIYSEDEVAPYREQMLNMALLMKRPEAVGIWTKAIEIDGSAEGHKQALLALQGIREAKAKAAAEPIVAQFVKLTESPSKDMGAGQEGALRYEMARTLGEIQAKVAVEPLVAALEQPEEKQPKPVYKAAIDALGQIGDPAAVDALIAVQFAVADAPGTQSIGERAVRALGAIGEPAVPKLLETMAGNNTKVNDLAAKKNVDVQIVQQSAVRILGVIGSPKATAALVAYMPQKDCGGDEEVDLDSLEDFDQGSAVGLRAFSANALGFIADPAAVEALCHCRNATHNPGDLWEIISALGRTGGDDAYACMEKIVTTGFYDPEEAVNSDFKYQVRWEGARWLVLSAPPAKAGAIKAAIEGNDPKVKEEVEKLGWMKGVAVLEECKEDVACYEKVMMDSTKSWFEREVGAFNFARMSKPGDIAAAAKLAKAFKTRDAGARINIAWLTAKVAAGTPCPECAEALEGVMKSEELTKDASMQGAWLTARQSIAKVTSGGGGAAPAPAEEAEK
ncbi:PBS lyase HEAT-like repeat protein [Enhygromyxa salina]|uniref:PBS lyase HEAT-like repeat protein n=1 Tax=Enhygromyxa salina TaxID=215803 RepID=A0A2S9YB20_9BACT|nr:HEAT repeat domain-containing protein [Enhygromyxa salina]PRQ02299.1 PBS lyase HEAT-like repeat protein [Enhygromyxa salina]